MVSKVHWTIQDYFKQAGVSLEGTRRRSTPSEPRSGAPDDFAQVLAGIQADSQTSAAGAGSGRRLADYRKTPVIARAPRPRGDASPGVAGASRAPVPTAPPSEAAATAGALRPRSTASADERSPASAPTQAAEPEGRSESVRRQIAESIQQAAADYRLPADLIRGVIRAESNFQVRAVSPAGAQGLMQLMPATARELGVADPFDIRQNIDGGARYLRRMLDMFDGDVKLALSAYNAGPGAVMKYDGRVPYAETRDYVRKVMRYAKS